MREDSPPLRLTSLVLGQHAGLKSHRAKGCAPPEAGPAEEDKGGLQARPSSGGCIYVCLCLST